MDARSLEAIVLGWRKTREEIMPRAGWAEIAAAVVREMQPH